MVGGVWLEILLPGWLVWSGDWCDGELGMN